MHTYTLQYRERERERDTLKLYFFWKKKQEDMSPDTLKLYDALKDISYEQHKVAFVAPPASRSALASKASSPAVCSSDSRATSPTPQKDGAASSSMKMDGYKLLKKKNPYIVASH
jgi:hypothetical protein